MNNQPKTRIVSLLRHAKSDWEKPGLDDHDRPLNARGRRAAPLVAKYIEEQRIDMDVILVSTAVRAQQTLELLIATWKDRPPTIYSTQNLYLASPQQILREVSCLDQQYNAVLIIGHNPGLGNLASYWAGKPLEYPTACLTVFSAADSSWADWSELPPSHLQLKNYCRPKDLE